MTCLISSISSVKRSRSNKSWSRLGVLYLEILLRLRRRLSIRKFSSITIPASSILFNCSDMKLDSFSPIQLPQTQISASSSSRNWSIDIDILVLVKFLVCKSSAISRINFCIIGMEATFKILSISCSAFPNLCVNSFCCCFSCLSWFSLSRNSDIWLALSLTSSRIFIAWICSSIAACSRPLFAAISWVSRYNLALISFSFLLLEFTWFIFCSIFLATFWESVLRLIISGIPRILSIALRVSAVWVILEYSLIFSPSKKKNSLHERGNNKSIRSRESVFSWPFKLNEASETSAKKVCPRFFLLAIRVIT